MSRRHTGSPTDSMSLRVEVLVRLDGESWRPRRHAGSRTRSLRNWLIARTIVVRLELFEVAVDSLEKSGRFCRKGAACNAVSDHHGLDARFWAFDFRGWLSGF